MDSDDVDRLRKLQAARLREARVARGFRSASAAAKRFGWRVVTYNKHEAGERGIGRMYRGYAKAFRVSPAWLLGHIDEKDSDVAGVPVMEQAAIGVWLENLAPASNDRTTGKKKVSIPARVLEKGDRFAVPVADSSMNRAFPQGTHVICADIAIRPFRADDFVVGDVLYIERTRDNLKEMSLRRVTEIIAKSLTISTFSFDAKLRHELVYPSARPDEKIRILGKVVGTYQDYNPA